MKNIDWMVSDNSGAYRSESNKSFEGNGCRANVLNYFSVLKV